MAPTTPPSAAGKIAGLFASPRNQRRLFVASAVVFVAGVIAIMATWVLRGTSDKFTSPISTIPAELVRHEKTVKPSAEAFRIARTFIATAVARQNLDASYGLVHPDLKGRLTRKQWDTGNIPVIDYPARNVETAEFMVDYSYSTQMLLEVDLVAKLGSGVRPHLLFFLGLKRQHGSKTGRWLVNYWEPHWKPPVPTP